MQKLKDEILREFDEKYGEFVFITGVESIRSGSIKQFLATAIKETYREAHEKGWQTGYRQAKEDIPNHNKVKEGK